MEKLLFEAIEIAHESIAFVESQLNEFDFYRIRDRIAF